jgi:hypothetical protein
MVYCSIFTMSPLHVKSAKFVLRMLVIIKLKTKGLVQTIDLGDENNPN